MKTTSTAVYAAVALRTSLPSESCIARAKASATKRTQTIVVRSAVSLVGCRIMISMGMRKARAPKTAIRRRERKAAHSRILLTRHSSNSTSELMPYRTFCSLILSRDLIILTKAWRAGSPLAALACSYSARVISLAACEPRSFSSTANASPTFSWNLLFASQLCNTRAVKKLD